MRLSSSPVCGEGSTWARRDSTISRSGRGRCFGRSATKRARVYVTPGARVRRSAGAVAAAEAAAAPAQGVPAAAVAAAYPAKPQQQQHRRQQRRQRTPRRRLASGSAPRSRRRLSSRRRRQRGGRRWPPLRRDDCRCCSSLSSVGVCVLYVSFICAKQPQEKLLLQSQHEHSAQASLLKPVRSSRWSKARRRRRGRLASRR